VPNSKQKNAKRKHKKRKASERAKIVEIRKRASKNNKNSWVLSHPKYGKNMNNWYIEKRREDPFSKQETTFLCHKERGDIMSDCPLEYEDRRDFFKSNPHGFIVVGGLGLGVVVDELLEIDSVDHIFIVEIDSEVINLTGGKYKDNQKVTIVHADVRDFDLDILPETPSSIYMDIWDDDLGTSYEERVDVCKHWGGVCTECFSWAIDRSRRDFNKRVANVDSNTGN